MQEECGDGGSTSSTGIGCEGTDVNDWGDRCRIRPPTGTIEATAHSATTATHICVNVVRLIDYVGMCIDVLHGKARGLVTGLDYHPLDDIYVSRPDFI